MNRPRVAGVLALALTLLAAASAAPALAAGAPSCSVAPFLDRKVDELLRSAPVVACLREQPLLICPLTSRLIALHATEEKIIWECQTPSPARLALLSRDHARLLLLFENGSVSLLDTAGGLPIRLSEPRAGVRAAAVTARGFALAAESGASFIDAKSGTVTPLPGEKSPRAVAGLAGRGGSDRIVVASASGFTLYAAGPDGSWPAVAVNRGELPVPGPCQLFYASEADAAADRPSVALHVGEELRQYAVAGATVTARSTTAGLPGVGALCAWLDPATGRGALLAASATGLAAVGADGKVLWRAAAALAPDTTSLRNFAPAFLYRFAAPPFLALAFCGTDGRLTVLSATDGAPLASTEVGDKTPGWPVEPLASGRLAGGESDSQLLWVPGVDTLRCFKFNGSPSLGGESASVTACLHEALPEPPDRGAGDGFSLSKLIGQAKRLYATRRNEVLGGAGLLVLLFLWPLLRRLRPGGRTKGLSTTDLNQQIARLREMLEKSPENVEILLNLAMILKKTDDREATIECYRTLVKFRPVEENYYLELLDLMPRFPFVGELVALYRRKGKVDAAILEFESRVAGAKAAGDDRPDAERILARLYAEAKRPEAIPALQRALERDGSLLDEWRLLADRQIEGGDPAAAAETLQRLVDIDRTGEAVKQVGRLLRLYHDLTLHDEAAEQFRLAIETRTGTGDTLIPIMSGLLDEAIARGVKKLVLLYGDCLVDAHVKNLDVNSALAALDRMLGLYPKELPLLKKKAFLLLEKGDDASLVPTFEALHRELPGDPRVKLEYIKILRRAERFADALALALDAVKKNESLKDDKSPRDNPFVEAIAAHALDEIKAGRPEAVVKGMSQIYAAGKSPKALPPLAEGYLRGGNLDRAQEIYSAYLKAQPADAKAGERLKYIATLSDERRLAEMKAAEAGDFGSDLALVIDGVEVRVKRSGDGAREDGPRSSPAEIKTAEAKLHFKKGEYKKAIPLFQELLKLQAGRKESLGTLLFLVTCFLKERLHAAAGKSYEAFDLEPLDLAVKERLNFRYRLAKTFEDHGELRQAEAIYGAVAAEEMNFMDAAERMEAVRKALAERAEVRPEAPADDGETTRIQKQATEADYIDRRYKVTAKLGKGGMGIVFKALDQEDGRECAIKIPLVQFKDDRGLIERFEREASVMERLKHPNVLEIFRVHRGELPYIVMEILIGQSLRDVLKESKTLPVARTRDIAVQVCDALDYTHHLKIVHRDIKPENIMLVEEGKRAKVMDFGLAKAADDSTMTSVGTILGTFAYISPEQALGDAVDGRADLYSLGIMFYEMLVGEKPFTSGDFIHQHLKVKPVPPTKKNAKLPYTVEAIVMKCLEKKPEDRYQTAAELKNDWLKII